MSSATTAPLRVCCVDDNELIAEALERRIERESTLSWAGFISDTSDILDRLRELAPDLVLMDVDIPGTDTFAMVERIASELPEVRVVMCSGYVNRAYIDRALDCGAWGYISKNEDVEMIIAAILRAGRGEIALSGEAETVWRRGTGPS